MDSLMTSTMVSPKYTDLTQETASTILLHPITTSRVYNQNSWLDKLNVMTVNIQSNTGIL